jgi:CRISPR system Cascade subunit CasA
VTSDTPEFDLLREPWIPVEWADGVAGAEDTVSVLDALRHAHEIRRVTEPSPLVVFGIYRLFAAILHTYVTVVDEIEWSGYWQEGRFREEHLRRAAEGMEGRLGLFHPTRPFYQSGDIPLGARPGEPLKSVGYLAAEVSTGTNVTHFGHRGESDHAHCPSCCARGLVTLPPFAIAGGAGIRPSINGTPPIYLLPAGETLFQTLWLNYLLPEARAGLAIETDPRPLWVEGGLVPSREERAAVEFVESLTWPARRIRLLPGSGGECSRCGCRSAMLVRQMVFAQGRFRPAGHGTWLDPWSAYLLPDEKSARKGEMRPVRPREDRAFWRDFGPLFLSTTISPNRGRIPAVVSQLSALQEDWLESNAPVSFQLFALRTDMKAKIFEWRHDVLDFPPAVTSDAEAADLIYRALLRADGVEGALRAGLQQLHPALQRGNRDARVVRTAARALTAGARRAYWQGLEGPFRIALTDPRLFETRQERERWLTEWWSQVTEAAKQEFERVNHSFEADAKSLECSVKAARVFYGRLKKITGGDG